MIPQYQRALFKFNNGNGALLCNCCRVIIKTGNRPYEDVEHYCEECRIKLERQVKSLINDKM